MINFSLVLFGFSASILISEALIRLFFPAHNFLQATKIDDEYLGHIVEPGTSGHDDWGFRNDAVPESAEIVAVGDSWTWGQTASATENWPSHLRSISQQSVYNLSMGGYSPIQYLYLVKQYALKLKPQTIIVGVYLGNDLHEAHSMATHLSWVDWGYEAKGNNAAVPSEARGSGRTFGGLSSWLVQNVATYNLLKLAYQNSIETADDVLWNAEEKSGISVLRSENSKTGTAFRTLVRLNVLDLSQPHIEAGLEITMKSLAEIKKLCEGIDLIVAVFPTKISIYRDQIRTTKDIKYADELEAVIENEDRVEGALTAFLEKNEMAYVLVRDDLQKLIGKKRIFRNHWDGHPNGDGYEAIAKKIYSFIQANKTR